MTSPKELRRLEHYLTWMRGVALLFCLVVIPLTPYWPDAGTRTAVWVTVGLFAVGTALVWGAVGRLESEQALGRLGMAAFTLDVLTVFAFIWLFAFEHPYITWSTVLLLPMEGALRYRMRGALAVTALSAVFFLLQGFHRAELVGRPFDLSTYLFIVGMTVLVGGLAGLMVENWVAHTRAYQVQSLKLAEADRLKDRFLAITSHEFRGPLAAILTAVETIRRRGDRLTPEQIDRLLQTAADQSRQLARLVDDLLVTSQIQAHKLALHPQPADLQRIVDQALEAAGPKRRNHRLEVFVEPLRVELDAARVSQILRNLVENAYKYTPDHSRVTVTARAADSGVVLEVEDDGPGLPADKRDQLFEAFFRLDDTAAGRDGVGLGLYVVSQLVSAMGGRIDLTSSARGTSFRIYLPCRVERAPHLEVVEGEAT